MNTGIKRFITCHVPVSACNFQCHYCYISQLKLNDKKIIPFCMPAKELAKKLSPERLGGYCYFNLCGNGETTLHPELCDFVSELTAQGHFVDIITNGTITQKFEELIDRLTPEQQNHFFVKFSFHYLELMRTNKMQSFIDNVNRIRKSEISYSIEITPNDELVPYIEDIKELSIREFGALPHFTVARNEATKDIILLTKYTREEYKNIWSQFNSDLFDFKFSIFNQKRTEFCYAGDWSLEIDLASGIYKQCYCGEVLGNLKNNAPIHFKAIGKCLEPHCFNGHAFLAFGDIPELKTPTYCMERDRVMDNGEHWLKEECQEFFSSKLKDNNSEYSTGEKGKSLSDTRKFELRLKARELAHNIKSVFRK